MIEKLHPSSHRLGVVDGLRGIALFAIIILHNFEHYNLFCFPEFYPDWLKVTDAKVWDVVWFLLAGKAFSAFSLLFGFSFYIQYANAESRGESYRGRFAWRMFLLVLFSQLHSIFYNGDILLLYAIIGLFLIAMCRVSTKAALIVAIILILQPVEWLRFFLSLEGIPFFEYGNHWQPFAAKANPVMEHGTLWEVIRSNLTYGQLYGNLWQIENGRICQIAGLFLFGMVTGRTELFIRSEKSIIRWKKIGIVSLLIFIPVYWAGGYVEQLHAGNPQLYTPLTIAIPSLRNFLAMAVLMSVFVLAWFIKGDGYKFQRMFVSFGRMSLTNYILQSIIGVTLYWGFGFGLYRYTGATACLIIACLMFTIQAILSRIWLNSHKQGPLEWLWKKGTWIGSKRKM